jgi:Ca2+-binding EF-hand superfamily protein
LGCRLISQIDKSGDGQVSKDEWLRAVLIALHKVDEDLCDLILDHFDELDVTKDGTLDAEDLKGAFGGGGEAADGAAAPTTKKERVALRKSMKQQAHQKAKAYHKEHKDQAKARLGVKAL